MASPSPSPLAIDDAIAFVDQLIERFQTSSIHSVSTAVKKEEKSLPEVTLKGGSLSSQQQEAGKNSVLTRPGKKSLKTPGVAAGEKPVKAEQPSDAKVPESVENYEKAHLQVGLVQSVADHPLSEKLYICKLEIGDGQIRQVVAGLKKFVAPSELQGKKVCVILNLKPAKLAGQLSEAMILAGDANVDGVETVKVLEPPADASVGDRVYLKGNTPSASPAKQLSSKIWEKIVPLLKVEGGAATYDNIPLVTSSGIVQVPSLPDGAGIH
ncbi:hypothetical protein R1flu_001286 [Riccia fluitans]|uniref:tRNA-binding domain-containing protein n=1 Tax=Riccia fluitans TaxID=41844 RepID=A0ABD1Y2V6_9MARC